jgi:hypothetical protein
MEMKMNNKFKMLLLAGSWAMSSAQAATIGLTLSSDKDPLGVSAGESITFTVGMTPVSAITGYTLDIRFDDAELDFDTSEQLVPFFNGAFVPPYTLDPATTASSDAGSTGLATSDSGRASVIQTNDSSPVGDLFSLTFTVLDPVIDGLDDLVVGILDTAADDINPPIGGEPFTIDPAVVSAQIGAVPVPAAVWLFGSGLLGLIGIARRRTA